MITFPNAKINLGLNIVERRPDGYHNLETVFYPVAIHDALEVNVMDEKFPSPFDCDIKVSNFAVEGDEQRNLVVRAYQLLKEDFPAMPRVHAHLYKSIPTQAGMGGGSSDASAMLLLLNKMFDLGIGRQQLIDYAARLGADCPFFIMNQPCYAEGIGERLAPVSLNLQGWYLAVVRPNIPVPTKEAFARVKPQRPLVNCRDIVLRPVEEWCDALVNDFEASVFAQHPEIGDVKEMLYHMGATYAAMSGSGSAVFGLFRQKPELEGVFEGMFKTVVFLP